MSQQATAEYGFQLVTPYEYELKLQYRADNAMLKHVFKPAVKKLRKKGIDTDGDVDKIDRFEIDERFHPLLRTNVRRHVRQVEKEVGRDGIKVLSDRVVKAVFTRSGSAWLIDVVMRGDYSDER